MICKICGKNFEPRRHNQKYCSSVCYGESLVRRQEAKRQGGGKICEYCGQIFKPRSEKSRFCSFDCAHKSILKKKAQNRAKERAELINAKVKKKTFAEWCREADECNMDYGNYRAQIEVFGKTFEELKARADQRSLLNPGSHIHIRTR